MSIMSDTYMYKRGDKYTVYNDWSSFMFPETLQKGAKTKRKSIYDYMMYMLDPKFKVKACAEVKTNESLKIADATNIFPNKGGHSFAGDMVYLVNCDESKVYYRKEKQWIEIE